MTKSIAPALLFAIFSHYYILLSPHRVVNAISANPNPVVFYDDDDALPPIYLRGDENYYWEEDKDGFTIIDDPDIPGDGNRTHKVYARVDEVSGNLVSTGIRLGGTSATLSTSARLSRLRAAGVKKHVKPSAKIRKERCGNFCNDAFSNSGRRSSHEEHKNRRRLSSDAGSLRNLVILIKFADHFNRSLPSPADYEILFNGPGGSSIAPTGSVSDVFLTNSYGKFDVESKVYPSWITLSKTEAYYGDNRSGLGPKVFEAIREALSVIDQDPNFDLSEFNTDYNQGDPYIDSITIMHSGYGAEFGGTDCFGTVGSSRIWSHNWFMYDGPWTSADGTVRVSSYHINPGLWSTCGSEISRIGVIAHEAMHFLGLPDLYDPQGGNGIGDYCLMANSWGVDGTQRYPPILSAWSKIELGWIEPMTISAKGDYTLRQSWQHPEVYKIPLRYDSVASIPNEYLLIENRQPGSFDVLLQLGGLAIWHIDENMYTSGNSVEGYPGQQGWPSNSQHYAVALLQADGRYDLERGINYGDFGDLYRFDYFFGVDFLFPSETSPTLGPNFPNTDSYGLGIASRTNHFISGITGSGPQMTFSVLLSSPCQPDEVHFELTLLTDGRGNEVSWTLSETYTNAIALSGDDYDIYSQYKDETCLPAKCYTFTINDSGSDGLCCSYGTGGYSVRLNGLKVASGDQFGSKDETDLKCLAVPPSLAPTKAPTKPTMPPTNKPSKSPSLSPSASPSIEPSFGPTGVCGRHRGLLEITLEGGEFVEGLSWDVTDIFGVVLLFDQVANSNGLYSIVECIPLDTCYTFAIHDALAIALGDSMPSNDEDRGLYSVKLDGEIIVSGSNFGVGQTTVFGDACLGDGDEICTAGGETTTPMSMFRLELANAQRKLLSWKLLDDTSKQVILSAGPFGECNVNSQAICLPREACYEFTMLDEEGCCRNGSELFTVLFTQTNDTIQNYTGTVSDYTSVFLGSCYDRNFS